MASFHNPPLGNFNNQYFWGTSIRFSGSASDDQDGDLTGNLVWASSLDGEIDTGGSFSAVLSEGTHTITAEVTDLGSLTCSASITVVVQPEAGSTVTVASLTGSSATVNKNFWRATVTATITPAPSGAVVSSTWDGGTAATCTTDSSGQCVVTTNVRTKTSTSSVTFTVDDVVLSGYEYVPGVPSVEVKMR